MNKPCGTWYDGKNRVAPPENIVLFYTFIIGDFTFKTVTKRVSLGDCITVWTRFSCVTSP